MKQQKIIEEIKKTEDHISKLLRPSPYLRRLEGKLWGLQIALKIIEKD